MMSITAKPTLAAVLSNNALLAQPRGDLAQRELGYNTCGYYWGLKNFPFECSVGSACVSNTALNAVACCSAGDQITKCGLPTSCVPRTAIAEVCTSSKCATDPFLTVCTDPHRQLCQTNLFDFDGTTTLSQVQCQSTGATFTVYNTYRGLTPTSGFQISYNNRITASSQIPSSTYNTGLAPFLATASRSTKAPAPVSHGKGLSKSDEGSSSSIAPIAGGVVGGVVAIAIMVAVIVIMCLRHRKQSRLQHADIAQRSTVGYYDDIANSSNNSPYGPVGTQEKDAAVSSRPYDPRPPVSPDELSSMVEADGKPMFSEADSKVVVAEADDGRKVHELP